jgi:hypothetical protein
MRRRTSVNKKAPKGHGIPVKPPQFEATFAVGKTVRFTATAATLISCSRASMLDLFVMATAANAASRIFEAVKIRRIRVWGNAPGAGAVAARTSSLQWLSTYSPSKVVSDSGSGASYGARISSKPPAMSLAGFWSLTGVNEADELFVLQLNQGDVVDIDLSFRIQNNVFGFSVPAAIVIIGGTVGTVYCMALDFVPLAAAAVVVPVEYITIT